MNYNITQVCYGYFNAVSAMQNTVQVTTKARVRPSYI